MAAAGQNTNMWEHSTIRLSKGDVTLFQSLGEPTQRRACLILYSGNDLGRRYALDGERMLIGRAPDCEVHIDSPGLSRRHAELQVEGDTVLLRDLGSANGTRVNDARVELPTMLKDGDLIRLGKVVLRYYDRQSLDALLHDRIYRIATVDAGTDVYTKRYFLAALEREMQLARRSQRPLSLVCLDLDFFKSVNDRWGHNAGDVVLREAASAMKQVVRGTDIIGRIGGEEFAVVLPETALAAALELAERLRAALAGQTVRLELASEQGGSVVLHQQTASLGVAELAPPMQEPRDLLGAADAQLYAAKRAGRNRVHG
jgi:diguanylate cyclase (GGDEF)-like protein